ncbi:DUF983 domain-containing protein [Lichenicoccus roseus]|nr:DUF983 domain-containing protein [Lichenicoccus roseus]
MRAVIETDEGGTTKATILPPATVPEDDEARAWLEAQSLPPLVSMVLHGLSARCPVCGAGRLYAGYLRLVPRCSACKAPLGAVRADDAPPYFTIFITAHIIIALVVLSTRSSSLPIWSLIAMLVPLTLVVALLLLRPVKGATVGVMLSLGLIGAHRDGAD